MRDAGPLEAVFAEHYVSLCRLAYLMVGDRDRAEEIVMDVFASTLARLGQVDNLEHYVRRGVANRCRNARRFRASESDRNRRHALSPLTPVSGPGDGDDETTLAVAALPVKQRMTIVLTYYLDLPVSEVAAVMGCSVGTVKSQLFKARAALQKALTPDA